MIESIGQINANLSADRVARVEKMHVADKLLAFYRAQIAAHVEAEAENNHTDALRYLMEANMAYAQYCVAKGAK